MESVQQRIEEQLSHLQTLYNQLGTVAFPLQEIIDSYTGDISNYIKDRAQHYSVRYAKWTSSVGRDDEERNRGKVDTNGRVMSGSGSGFEERWQSIPLSHVGVILSSLLEDGGALERALLLFPTALRF